MVLQPRLLIVNLEESTARLLCTIMALAVNKLTHVGNTDHFPQLRLPTNASYPIDTAAYGRGYLYLARNKAHLPQAAPEQELQPQDPGYV